MLDSFPASKGWSKQSNPANRRNIANRVGEHCHSTYSLSEIYPSRCLKNKKAELPQRWPRDASYVWVPWKFSRVSEYLRVRPRLLLPKFLMGFCSDRSY